MDNNVIPSQPVQPTQAGDPIQPTQPTEEGLDPKTKEGFQRLVAKKDEDIRAKEEEARLAREELARLQEERRQAKLAQMSKEEQVAEQNKQLAAENAKLKLEKFVTREVAKRNLKLTDPLIEIVMEAPWDIPVVKRSLGDSPTWAEVISAVETKLPSYLDSLVSSHGVQPDNNGTTPSQEPASQASQRVADPERQPNNLPKRTWTTAEIDAMSTEDYKKHQQEIKQAWAEGRVVTG